MLKHALKKTTVWAQSPIITRSLTQPSRLLPTCSFNLYSNYSTAPNKKNTPQHVLNRHRRMVIVESPFAAANKLLYHLPEDPFLASERVARILEIGTIGDALDYVKALPIYLQSVVVWNQLIGHCAKSGRASIAEKYYIQMRKRGIEPNDRTITHMLIAYTHSNSPNAIESAEGWFSKLKDFNLKPSTIHINNLMRVYSASENPEKALELLKRISRKGDIVPDEISYTIGLWACPKTNRPSVAISEIWHDVMVRVDQLEKRQGEKVSRLSRKASAISIVHEEVQPLRMDDGLVMALLNAVSKTARTEADLLVAVETIDRLYSVCPPRAAEIMKRGGMVLETRKPGYGFQPSLKVLDSILHFAGTLKEYALGDQYYKLILEQYPRLIPDKQVHQSHKFIQYHLDRKNNFTKPDLKKPDLKKPDLKKPDFKKPDFKKPDFKKQKQMAVRSP